MKQLGSVIGPGRVRKRALLAITCAWSAVLWPLPAAAQPVFIELRRTFTSPECDSGEVHVNGMLVSLFHADPAMFHPADASARIIDGKISAESFTQPGLYFSNMQTLVVRTSDGQAAVRLVMLNNESFSPFQRRVRTRRLPADHIVLGSSLSNRTCQISTNISAPIYADDARLSVTTNLMGAAVFGIAGLATRFPTAETRDGVIAFTDRAHRFQLGFGSHSYQARLPAAGAGAVASGDPCLSKLEHMRNTIVRTTGTSYERRDDVVVCATGILDGQPAIETRQDVRYIAIQEVAACATVFGLPLGRSWFIVRGFAPAAGPVYTQCVGNDTFQSGDAAVWISE